ncbi:hypothetical protein [Synechococcus sp. NOUM97013]|uniref:hypothetical protein n=1 Tax=Synechococcus sp. NOUM97013 TaxID=1442555 RepID=UPI00164839D1|nr:hypothetical protein [Synechococcus sp. NOUM97013]
MDQPADHSGVENVWELLSQTRPGLPNPPRFFSILSQSQMRTPIEHQPGRQPLKKEVRIEGSHQIRSADEFWSLAENTLSDVFHHSFIALKRQGLHRCLHPSKPSPASTNEPGQLKQGKTKLAI